MRGLSLLVFRLSLALTIFACVREARPQTNDGGASLSDAVKQFNAKAAKDPIGAKEPPLTEDEVVAAIRGWIRSETKVDDKTYATYIMIINSRKLPEGASLGFTTGWSGYHGYDFTVWWIDLNVKTGPRTGYTYRIRSRLISSEPTKFSRAEVPRIAK